MSAFCSASFLYLLDRWPSWPVLYKDWPPFCCELQTVVWDQTKKKRGGVNKKLIANLKLTKPISVGILFNIFSLSSARTSCCA